MKTDPMTYILAAALLSFCFGFLACAIMASRRIRNADKDAWREAAEHFRRLYSAQDSARL